MFCPTCGEMAFIRDGNGDERTYYERVESSVNQGWVWWQEEKPVLEDYNSDGSRKGNEQGLLCNYHGPAKKLEIGGKEIDFHELTSSVEVETREYTPIPDSSTASRIKTNSYNCPKCSCSEAYIDPQRIEFGEVPVISLECTECGRGWRES